MSNDFDENNDIFAEIEKDIEQAFSGFQDSLFDVGRQYLKPLYRIEVNEDQVKVIFDLPGVEKKEDLILTSTEQTLRVEARMRKPVSMMVGGPYQRNVEFDRYSKKIHLPVEVDPNKAKARFRNGILIMEFPIAGSGSPVKIE